MTGVHIKGQKQKTVGKRLQVQQAPTSPSGEKTAIQRTLIIIKYFRTSNIPFV